MLCPICKNINLSIADRQGIEIDFCPQCRGVWLDRGELDRIIERTEQVAPPQPVMDRQRSSYEDGRAYEREVRPRYESDDYRRKKKKSLLGELFDF